jgi:hypothetical protein
VTGELLEAAIRLARSNPDPGALSSVIVALADQRAELVALLTDTTVHGGTCDGIDNEDGCPPLTDDPLYHECTDVDEHQATPCWGHQVRALLVRIGVTP